MLKVLRIIFIVLCTLALLYIFSVKTEAAPRDRDKRHSNVHFSIHFGPERQHVEPYYFRSRYQYPYTNQLYFYPYLPYYSFGRHWIFARGGYVPFGAVVAGRHYGRPIFYCRARYKDKWHYGALYANGCHLYWDGHRAMIPRYEVLVR